MLSRARVRPHFGNAGEVENLITLAKSNFQSRQSRIPPLDRDVNVVFDPEDFDPNYKRAENAEQTLVDLFKDMVGMDVVVDKLRGFRVTLERMKERGQEYRDAIPTTFLFKGPPGKHDFVSFFVEL